MATLRGSEPQESLSTVATRGAIWVGVSQITTQIMQFAVTVILARFLLPEDFGVIGIAAVIVGITTTIDQMGFSAAIIQRAEIRDDHLAIAFWINLVIRVVSYILLFFLSPLIADPPTTFFFIISSRCTAAIFLKYISAASAQRGRREPSAASAGHFVREAKEQECSLFFSSLPPQRFLQTSAAPKNWLAREAIFNSP